MNFSIELINYLFLAAKDLVLEFFESRFWAYPGPPQRPSPEAFPEAFARAPAKAPPATANATAKAAAEPPAPPPSPRLPLPGFVRGSPGCLLSSAGHRPVALNASLFRPGSGLRLARLLHGPSLGPPLVLRLRLPRPCGRPQPQTPLPTAVLTIGPRHGRTKN